MPGTPSLVSDCPSSASPSKVAKSPSLFRAWRDGAKVVEKRIPPLAEVPSILVQGPFRTPVLDNEPEFQLAVRTWASTLRPVEGDEYGILPVLSTLALAFSRVRKMSDNHSKEHSQRRGIDDIIELAFSARLDRHCDFKTEESYRLVASAGNPDAQSDTLVTIPSVIIADKIGEDRFSFQGDRTISEHLYWSTGGSTDGFSIIGFAGEFKKDENDCNKNQLIMVLATAQAQRKALLLKQSIIMGAIASCGIVQIFSSYWTTDDSLVRIYAHKQQFNLSDSVQVIRLYVFCSKLERELQGTLALELKTWNTPTETTLQSHKWRSPDHSRKRRRTEAGGSSNGSNRGRGGGNIGPEEADGFDGDQYMDIMKWRDEVVKDGKEGRVVSDEDNILDAAWLQFEGRAIAPLS
ncbi:hypothetical protein F5887DRAFT_1198087 [Amanita rubescens]|nr:hypothetical protein F5887DRAFT_1198087 [Amanita rubescens]